MRNEAQPTPAAELFDRVKRTLRAAGVVFAEREASWILEAATGRNHAQLLGREMELGPSGARLALELASRRAAGEPLQYVTGTAGFRKLDLSVGPGVFIPRPETELLAELAIEVLPPRGVAVDVGTGSGAIALSLALERPDARVIATESSRTAMDYARRNRDQAGLSVELVLGDLLQGLPDELRGHIDVCVSNPPYVPLSESHLLPSDVVEHEPSEALFAGRDGLAVVKSLVEDASGWLGPEGWLLLEIGDRQGEAARAMLGAAGFRGIEVRRDLTGRERIALARV